MFSCATLLGQGSKVRAQRLFSQNNNQKLRLHLLSAAQNPSPISSSHYVVKDALLENNTFSCLKISPELLSVELQHRCYITRAHAQPRPIFSIPEALKEVIKGAEERKQKKQKRWERFPFENPDGKKKHPDETVEIALGLNLDPRRPGQALRGSISLPHGSGKKLRCIVFTNNEEAAQLALEKGATHAGGEELVDSVAKGEVALDQLDRALGTSDIMPMLSKKLARILGPRGLMPNPKTGTVLQSKDELVDTLVTQIAGKEIVYRTEKEGQVLVGVGKVSFGVEKLLENIGDVIKEIHAVKPEQYGKGKKAKGKTPTGKGVKYVLQVYVTSTQGSSFKVDLTTLDPTGPFFLKDSENALPKAADTNTATEEAVAA